MNQTSQKDQIDQSNQFVALQVAAKSVQYTDASIGLALLTGDAHLRLAGIWL
jgi:hypothetical protein